jgi:hypothetical protein
MQYIYTDSSHTVKIFSKEKFQTEALSVDECAEYHAIVLSTEQMRLLLATLRQVAADEDEREGEGSHGERPDAPH